MKHTASLFTLAVLVASCANGGSIDVTDAWARTSPSMTTAGAVYMEIRNATDTDDALVAASADASIAARVEVHESTAMEPDTTMAGETGSTMGGDEMMAMRPVDRIPIPAGESLSLEPGGYHVMLLDLVEPLAAGSTITVTLSFEVAGDVEVEADVRDTAP